VEEIARNFIIYFAMFFLNQGSYKGQNWACSSDYGTRKTFAMLMSKPRASDSLENREGDERTNCTFGLYPSSGVSKN
jgi:hypothetical protein